MFKGIKKFFMGEWDFYANETTKYARRARRAYDKENYTLARELASQGVEALKKHPVGGLILLRMEIERNDPPQPYYF